MSGIFKVVGKTDEVAEVAAKNVAKDLAKEGIKASEEAVAKAAKEADKTITEAVSKATKAADESTKGLIGATKTLGKSSSKMTKMAKITFGIGTLALIAYGIFSAFANVKNHCYGIMSTVLDDKNGNNPLFVNFSVFPNMKFYKDDGIDIYLNINGVLKKINKEQIKLTYDMDSVITITNFSQLNITIDELKNATFPNIDTSLYSNNSYKYLNDCKKNLDTNTPLPILVIPKYGVIALVSPSPMHLLDPFNAFSDTIKGIIGTLTIVGLLIAGFVLIYLIVKLSMYVKTTMSVANSITSNVVPSDKLTQVVFWAVFIFILLSISLLVVGAIGSPPDTSSPDIKNSCITPLYSAYNTELDKTLNSLKISYDTIDKILIMLVSVHLIIFLILIIFYYLNNPEFFIAKKVLFFLNFIIALLVAPFCSLIFGSGYFSVQSCSMYNIPVSIIYNIIILLNIVLAVNYKIFLK